MWVPSGANTCAGARSLGGGWPAVLTARGSGVATRSGALPGRKALLSLKGTSLASLSRSSPRTRVLRAGSTASARHRAQVWLQEETEMKLLALRPGLRPAQGQAATSLQGGRWGRRGVWSPWRMGAGDQQPCWLTERNNRKTGSKPTRPAEPRAWTACLHPVARSGDPVGPGCGACMGVGAKCQPGWGTSVLGEGVPGH